MEIIVFFKFLPPGVSLFTEEEGVCLLRGFALTQYHGKTDLLPDRPPRRSPFMQTLPPGRPPPLSEITVNRRAVPIQLECILVIKLLLKCGTQGIEYIEFKL